MVESTGDDAGCVVADMRLFEIPEELQDAVRSSWRNRQQDLYGRFDLLWDGNGPPKMLECVSFLEFDLACMQVTTLGARVCNRRYNGDTATVILESGPAQRAWLESKRQRLGKQSQLLHHLDQFNSIEKELSAAWSVPQETIRILTCVFKRTDALFEVWLCCTQLYSQYGLLANAVLCRPRVFGDLRSNLFILHQNDGKEHGGGGEVCAETASARCMKETLKWLLMQETATARFLANTARASPGLLADVHAAPIDDFNMYSNGNVRADWLQYTSEDVRKSCVFVWCQNR